MNKPKALQPIYPNQGLQAEYRRKLERLIQEMHRSVSYWISVAYKQNKPELLKLFAEDASPANVLRLVMRRLARRWLRRWNEASQDMAKHFALSAAQRSDIALRNILKKNGISVEFKPSKAVKDILQASVHENVSLIKSIPQQYLSKVEQSVMRSVQTGRDLHQLTEDLHNNFGVTKRRAAFIARDQNNKVTAAITRTRQAEAGLKQAQWVHSGAGRHPRPTHVKAGRDKITYDISEGWFDPAIKRHIWPGTEINCRCVSRPVLPI